MKSETMNKSKIAARKFLSTTQQQRAYTEIIQKENKHCQLQLLQSQTLRELSLTPGLKSDNAFQVLKTDNFLHDTVQIGRNLKEITFDREGVKRHTISKPKERPWHLDELFGLGPVREPFRRKMKQDRHYDRQKFLNRENAKELYKVPLRSSDAYGWFPPLDDMVFLGNEREKPPQEFACFTKKIEDLK